MAIQTGRAMPRRAINLEGAILVPHSLAHVNRELALALLRQGIDLGLCPTEPDQPHIFTADRFAPLGRCQSYPEPEVVLRHRWPPDLGPAGDAFLVQLMHWEFGAIPRAWLEPLQRHTHELWVLSTSVRDAFVRGGIDPERIAVLGGGVDPEIFTPAAPPLSLPTRKGFRFLFVGPPLRRKGVDVLLAAYQAEFGADEDVTLVVKDVRAYANDGRDLLTRAAHDTTGPEVVILDEDIPAGSMPGLYTACDALVQPYRGEGLCLPLLEAMACGIPVAATAHGACLDYLHEGNGLMIPAAEVSFAEDRVDSLETVGRPFWAEPDLPALRGILRRLFEEGEASAPRTTQARRDIAGNWTWDGAARTARARLDALFAERDSRLRALELLVEGAAALEAGNAWQARPALQAALTLEPCFPDALSEYGVALAQTDCLDEAYRILCQALELAPGHEEARNNLAVVTALLADANTGSEPLDDVSPGERWAA